MIVWPHAHGSNRLSFPDGITEHDTRTFPFSEGSPEHATLSVSCFVVWVCACVEAGNHRLSCSDDIPEHENSTCPCFAMYAPSVALCVFVYLCVRVFVCLWLCTYRCFGISSEHANILSSELYLRYTCSHVHMCMYAFFLCPTAYLCFRVSDNRCFCVRWAKNN